MTSLLEGLDLEWSLINNANGSLVPFDLFFVLPEKLSVQPRRHLRGQCETRSADQLLKIEHLRTPRSGDLTRRAILFLPSHRWSSWCRAFDLHGS